MRSHNNLHGILWMVFGVLAFAFGDLFLKMLAGAVPAGQVMVYLGLGGTLVFGLMSFQARVGGWTTQIRHPAVFLRTCSEALAASGFVMAFAVTPLSQVAAIMQANPLLVTLGAAIWLKEPVGRHRWSAIFIGFIGVMLVIQPWGARFEPGALFAVWGTVFLSLRDLLTRKIPNTVPTVQLGVYAMAGIIPMGLLLHWVLGHTVVSPDTRQILILIAATAMMPIGFYAVTMSMRSGEISAVAPFRYSRLFFAMALAAIVLGERPDAMTWIGAAVIVASGLYTIWREHVLATKSTP